MPTYEYACSACGHQFDRFESIKAEPNNVCEKCNKKKAVRKISGGGGFLFKGTGFYITDYKKGGSGASREENKPAAPAGAGACCKGDPNCGASKSSDSSSAPAKSEPSSTPAKSTESSSSSTKSKKPSVA